MNEKEITCTSINSDYDGIKMFKSINENAKPKEYSQLVVMNNREPFELWDFGLNEKVIIPDKNHSSCKTIREFVRFIETRKFKK